MPDITLPPKNMKLVPDTAPIPQALLPTPLPESLHPGFVTNPDNHPTISGIKVSKSFHENAVAQLNSLNELKAKPMPTMNAAQIATELQAAGHRVKVNMEQQFRAAAQTVDREIAETKHKIAAFGGFAEDKQAPEMRQVLRGLSEQERVAAIDQALADKDERLLSAFLEAHPLTLGVSRAFIEGARLRWLSSECPQQLADLDALTKERARLQESIIVALNTADEASRGIEEYAPAIEAAKAARVAFS